MTTFDVNDPEIQHYIKTAIDTEIATPKPQPPHKTAAEVRDAINDQSLRKAGGDLADIATLEWLLNLEW